MGQAAFAPGIAQSRAESRQSRRKKNQHECAEGQNTAGYVGQRRTIQKQLPDGLYDGDYVNEETRTTRVREI